MRQHFFATKSILGFTELYHKISKTTAYRALPNTKVAKQVLRRIHKAWLGYGEAHKDWRKNQDKYLGEPRIPKYKDKLKGRYALIYPDETVSKPLLRKGLIKLTPSPIEFSSGLTEVDEVRVIPKSGCYVVEVVYRQEEMQSKSDGEVAGIDMGLVNLVTLTTNQSGVKPLLIKGGALKAINTFYNKQKAKLQSELESRHETKTSRRLNALTHKRNCRVDNYLHTASRRVIDWCLRPNITTLVIGKNENWKQAINLGKRTNQQFVNIPHARLIEMITYKGCLVGIKVIVTEESYTSKSSLLDNDPLPKYGQIPPIFSGKRVKRGLYRSASGRLINPDVNGSFNAIRKVKPDVFDRGLKGLPFSPVALDPLRTHDFLQVA
jgi:IS605 OrfB family transposase